MMQGALSKERRDLKIQQQREKDSQQSQGGSGAGLWIQDPMAEVQDKYNPNLSGAERKNQDMPEWKRHVTAGGKASYGKRTNLTIKEQRESLPIYALKDQLLQAIEANQVCRSKIFLQLLFE